MDCIYLIMYVWMFVHLSLSLSVCARVYLFVFTYLYYWTCFFVSKCLDVFECVQAFWYTFALIEFLQVCVVFFAYCVTEHWVHCRPMFVHNSVPTYFRSWFCSISLSLFFLFDSLRWLNALRTQNKCNGNKVWNKSHKEDCVSLLSFTICCYSIKYAGFDSKWNGTIYRTG